MTNYLENKRLLLCNVAEEPSTPFHPRLINFSLVRSNFDASSFFAAGNYNYTRPPSPFCIRIINEPRWLGWTSNASVSLSLSSSRRLLSKRNNVASRGTSISGFFGRFSSFFSRFPRVRDEVYTKGPRLSPGSLGRESCTALNNGRAASKNTRNLARAQRNAWKTLRGSVVA